MEFFNLQENGVKMLVRIRSKEDYNNFCRNEKRILIVHRGIFPLSLATTEIIKNKYASDKDLIFGDLDSLGEPGIFNDNGLFNVYYFPSGKKISITNNLKADQAVEKIISNI